MACRNITARASFESDILGLVLNLEQYDDGDTKVTLIFDELAEFIINEEELARLRHLIEKACFFIQAGKGGV
jgi:hypothetical protein